MASSESLKDSNNTSDSIDLRLDTDRFLYQNRWTGRASTTPLTLRQLCRIVAAAVRNHDETTTTTPAMTAAWNANTQVIQVLIVQNKNHQAESDNDRGTTNATTSSSTWEYSPAGWQSLGSLVVFQRLFAIWYYQDSNTGQVLGPISCPTLADAYYYDGNLSDLRNSRSDDVSSPATSRSTVTNQTRVCAVPDPRFRLSTGMYESNGDVGDGNGSAAGNNADDSDTESTSRSSPPRQTDEATWRTIHEDVDLMTVLRALQPAPPLLQSFEADTASANHIDAFDSVTEPAFDVLPTQTNDLSNEAPPLDVLDDVDDFLASTERSLQHPEDEDVDEQEAYESDGGTNYLKDCSTRQWIEESAWTKIQKQRSQQRMPSNDGTGITTHAAPAESFKRPLEDNTDNIKDNTPKKRKRKKSQFASRNARCWIYVTGLPPDTDEHEVAQCFSKAGILDLDPETQRPKIKLYRDKTKTINRQDEQAAAPCKGDASICYARPESVELAMTLLDEAPFRYDHPNQYILHVQRAKFEAHINSAEATSNQSGSKDTTRHSISQAKRKVAKLATRQAVDWDDGGINGRLTGGRKGLHIVVLKHVFAPWSVNSEDGKASSFEAEEDQYLAALENQLRAECEVAYGPIEKITFFSKHPQGVVVLKFAQPGAASAAVQGLDGRIWEPPPVPAALLGTQPRKQPSYMHLRASFWDGVTDYTVRSDDATQQAEMERRQEEFGEWLESTTQELPEEFRLQGE